MKFWKKNKELMNKNKFLTETCTNLVKRAINLLNQLLNEQSLASCFFYVLLVMIMIILIFLLEYYIKLQLISLKIIF